MDPSYFLDLQNNAAVLVGRYWTKKPDFRVVFTWNESFLFIFISQLKCYQLLCWMESTKGAFTQKTFFVEVENCKSLSHGVINSCKSMSTFHIGKLLKWMAAKLFLNSLRNWNNRKLTNIWTWKISTSKQRYQIAIKIFFIICGKFYMCIAVIISP